MKKLLLPLAAAVLAPFANAGDDVVAFNSTTGVSVIRGGGNMYRQAPRGGNSANLSSADRYRAVIYRPTQHFYFRDSVVSYRYSSNLLSDVGSEYGGSYHGPHGAQFVPIQHDVSPDGRIRSYATMNKRPQPGVPMVSRSSKIVEAAESAPVTTIQLANAR